MTPKSHDTASATPRHTVLWVDDDVYFIHQLAGYVRDTGVDIRVAESADKALELMDQLGEKVSMVIVDMMMPPGESFSDLETKGGYTTGLALTRRILQSRPAMPILAFSVASDSETMTWFDSNTEGYLVKPARPNEIVRAIHRAVGSRYEEDFRGPRIFVVHGHDETALYQLKEYIQSTLGLPRPVVLREQPSLGRTIIEKFEAAADETDLVFVLLTPDDEATAASGNNMRRARQNVIFELGYFFAKLQRHSGRVLLLHKGPLEIPSDISGLIYVDISNGIESAGEVLRRELARWLVPNAERLKRRR